MPIASLTNLRNILSDLYDSEADIRLICRDAGLPVHHLVLAGPAANAWNAALDEAQKQSAVGHLYVRARRQYPKAALRKALDNDSPQLAADVRAATIAEAMLYDLVQSADLAPGVIEGCYNQALGGVPAKVHPIGGDLALAVVKLWELADEPRRRCVPAFAQRIADHLRTAHPAGGAGLAADIERWVEHPNTLEALRMEPGDAAAIRAGLAAEGRLFLLVAIAPDLASFQGSRHQRFQIGLHPYREGQAGQPGRHQPRWEIAEQTAATGTAYDVERLPAIIVAAIDEIGEHYGQEVSLIELFLPLELMDQGVEQWEVQRRMPEKLFSRGQIVVRSWDLATDDYFKAARKRRSRKWENFDKWRLRRLRRETDEEFVPCCWEHLQALKPDAVFNDYYLNDDLAHACVGMAFAPPVARSRAAKPELLDVLIEAGVPIMLWLRQGPTGGADSRVVLGELENLVRAAALDDLPRAVHQRRVAAAGAQDWGYHLALYWENAEHSLPQGNSHAW